MQNFSLLQLNLHASTAPKTFSDALRASQRALSGEERPRQKHDNLPPLNF